MIIDELIAILGYDIQGEEDLKRFRNGLKEATRDAQELAQRLGRGVALAGAALAAGLGFLGKSVIDTGAQFENLGVRLEALEGSAEAGQRALEWVREFAEETPLSLSEAADAYARLKTFGIDPTNGALLAAVDTMAMAGQGADYLGGVVLAMGQAWTKQKLQGEEALQLIERGVPVWDMLAEAMGKSVPEIQKLSEQGRLGRKEMLLLFDAMGNRAAGASAKMARTWTGLMGRLGDQWEKFLKLIADNEVFDNAKRIVEDMLVSIEGAFTDGRAERAARFFSGLFVGIANGIARVSGQITRHIGFIIDNIDALRPYLYGLAAGFGVLLAATFPVTTALLGIALVIDDILTYLEGGKSVFGDVVKWLRELTGIPEEIAAAFTGIGAIVASALGVAFIAMLPTLVARLALLFVTGLATAIGGLAGIVSGGLAGIFALLLTPAGWAVIIAGIGAALVAYFWDDIVAAAPRLISAGVELGNALFEGIKSIGGAIADWFAGLVPDWAAGFFAGSGGPARPKNSEVPPETPATSSPTRGRYNIPAPATPPGSSVPQMPAGRGRYGSRAMENFEGNMAKMSAPAAAQAVVTDNSQDNRQYPVTVNAPVTITVQQATQAPGALQGAMKGAVETGARAGGAVPARMQPGPVQ